MTTTPDLNVVKTGPTTYERRLSDGTKQIFGLSDGATSYPRQIFMTQIVDAAGNPIVVSGNNGHRVREAPVSRARIYAYVMPTA